MLQRTMVPMTNKRDLHTQCNKPLTLRYQKNSDDPRMHAGMSMKQMQINAGDSNHLSLGTDRSRSTHM